MPGSARRKHAIHHVNARLSILRNLVGSANSHQIPRLVGGKMFQRRQDNFTRKLARFANAKPADGISRKANVDGAFGRLAAQFTVHAALHNAKQIPSLLDATPSHSTL